MQLYLGANTPQRVRPRIAELATGLGIDPYQQAAWDLFVETLIAVEDALESIDRSDLRQDGFDPPTLSELMQNRAGWLAAQLEATSLLKASLDVLCRSLSLRQRARADRLLAPLLNGIAATGGPPRRAVH